MKKIIIGIVVLAAFAAGIAFAQSTVNYSTPIKTANVLRIDRIEIVPYTKSAQVCGTMMNAKDEAVESKCAPLDFKTFPGVYNVIKWSMAILGTAFSVTPSIPIDPTK